MGIEDANVLSFMYEPEGTVFLTWSTAQKVKIVCTGKDINIIITAPARIVLSNKMLPF